MRHTEKDDQILIHLGTRAVLHMGPMTCRQLSEFFKKTYVQWAMPSLRRLELRGFVRKADQKRFNDIAWEITDAGLERLTLDHNAPVYRLFAQQASGATPRA